jgi:hypothetical protein
MIMLKNATTHWIERAARGAALAVLTSAAAAAATSATYPAMAPAAQYMIASPADEIALARSAAPPSISRDAEVLVLGPHGYVTAARGTNGFVCLVERSWDAGFDDPVFWNPHIRGADCLNPAAAKSVLSLFMERARWALGGVSKADMVAKTKTEVAMGAYPMPAPGAMAFMMSKDQVLNDSAVHHWHPHLMFFIANAKDASWGANLEGSPVLTAPNSTDPFTTFFVPVGKWSDGTPYEAPPMKMN